MHGLRILVEQMSQQLSQIALFGGQNAPGEHGLGLTNGVTSSASTIITRSAIHSDQDVTTLQSSAASIITLRRDAGNPFLAGSGETIRSMSSFNFESTLLNTRVYSRALYRPWMNTASAGGWSVLSGRSLAEVSNISVLELPLHAGTLSNPWWYDGSISSMDFLASLPVELHGRELSGDSEQNPMERLRNLDTMSWSAALHVLEPTNHATKSIISRTRQRWTDILSPSLGGGAAGDQEPTPGPHDDWFSSPGNSPAINPTAQELDSLPVEMIRSNRPPPPAEFCYCEATAGESPFIIAVLEGNLDAADIYLTGGSYIQELDRIGNTALSCAAKVGHLEIVQLLLDRGADVNAAGITGLSPLQWAASYGHSAVIELLLEHGANAAYCCSASGPIGSIGYSRGPQSSGQAIWHAARMNHSEAVSSFLNHATPVDLLHCCERCKTTIFDNCWPWADLDPCRLISKVSHESGGPWEIRVAFLQQAMDRKDFVEAAKLAHTCTGRELIDCTGRPMLYSAIEAGAIELIELFWYEGVDSTWADVNGRPLLHFAAEIGSEAAVDSLLRHGLDTTALDREGHRPLYFALQNRHDSVAAMLTSQVSLLDDTNCAGYLDLHDAARLGLPMLAERLLELGMPVDRTDSNGCTALHKAAVHGHEDLVELLLSHGSNRDAVDDRGGTPLVHAVREGQLRVAQRLCQISPPTIVIEVTDSTRPLRTSSLTIIRHQGQSCEVNTRQPAWFREFLPVTTISNARN